MSIARGTARLLLSLVVASASSYVARAAEGDFPDPPARHREDEPSYRQGRDGARWYDRAMDAHQDGRYGDAIAAWQQAIDRDFRTETAMYNLACSHALSGNPDAALTWLGRAGDAGFDLASYLGEDDDLASLRDDPRFRHLLETANVRELERLGRRFDRLAAAGSATGSAWYELAMELHHAGDYARAEQAWGKAVALGHRAGTATYNIACARALAGQSAAALDALARSIELGFADPEQIESDADLRSLRSDPRFQAILTDARALELPSDGWGWRLFAGSSRTTWAESIARYERYLERQPRSGHAWFNLGLASLRVENPARAVEAFSRAYDLGFRPPVSAYDLACAHARAGRTEEAFTWLARALDLGFDEVQLMAHDPDLDSLRDDPRFSKLVPEPDHRHDGHIESWIEHLFR